VSASESPKVCKLCVFEAQFKLEINADWQTLGPSSIAPDHKCISQLAELPFKINELNKQADMAAAQRGINKQAKCKVFACELV